MRRFPTQWIFVLATAIFLFTGKVSLCEGDWNPDPLGIYPTAWGRIAKEKGVDPYILYSIALIESRRSYKDGLVRPWPFAIGSNTPPKSYYPSSRQEAETLLNKLLKKSKNIDVGMLQVNLIHHGHRVKHPTNLLDYQKNIEIGAQILQEAMNSAPDDLELGVGRYHNWQFENLSRSYGKKVLRLAYSLKKG